MSSQYWCLSLINFFPIYFQIYFAEYQISEQNSISIFTSGLRDLDFTMNLRATWSNPVTNQLFKKTKK